MNKHTWSNILNVFGAVFAIGFPFVAIWIKYGALFRERQSFAFVTGGVGIAIALAILWVMHWLKGLAEHGLPMERTVAREVRFLLPLLVVLAILSVIHLDLGGIVTVLGFSIVGNIIAIPLRIVGYRMGKRYEHDMSSVNTLSAVQQMANEARIYREKQNKKPKPKVKTNPVK
jgi:uncharacterized protein YacL